MNGRESENCLVYCNNSNNEKNAINIIATCTTIKITNTHNI